MPIKPNTNQPDPSWFKRAYQRARQMVAMMPAWKRQDLKNPPSVGGYSYQQAMEDIERITRQ